MDTANNSENYPWEELPEDVRIAINKAKNELDNGEGIAHEVVMAEARERFLR